jgi:hypothetical protein
MLYNFVYSSLPEESSFTLLDTHFFQYAGGDVGASSSVGSHCCRLSATSLVSKSGTETRDNCPSTSTKKNPKRYL